MLPYPEINSFKEIWLVDFEFRCPPGHLPRPVCMVASELRSGRTIRLQEDELNALSEAPFSTDDSSLVLAYFASAEMSCFLALGWKMPRCLIDLYAEFRCMTNGRPVPDGNGLLGALRYFGLPSIAEDEKGAMRDLIMNHAFYSSEQWRLILNYCASDVEALGRLWTCMEPMIRGPYALFRGDYVKSVALMERRGVPVNADLLFQIKTHRQELQMHLIAEVERRHHYGIYDGLRFSSGAFDVWLSRRGVPWPRTETGALKLDDETFKDMAKLFPALGPLRTLRQSLSQLRSFDLPAGPDGRNRFMISPFSSVSGRNQPSTSKCIFGQSKWLRQLIRPEPGRALAYIDWEQQEFGIVAALSGDVHMMESYRSGDPYLSFAKLVGAVPPDATKESHPRERAIYKTVVLGVQFSMGVQGLTARLNCSPAHAAQLLKQHRKAFPRYWEWTDRVVNYAQLCGPLVTALGWQRYAGSSRPASMANHPSQANGAEMMRMASVLAMEAGVEVCCPVHDAFLIEAPLEEINQAVARMQACMAEASRIILSGFELRSEAEVIRYPDSYHTEGAWVWDIVMPFIEQRTPDKLVQGGGTDLSTPPYII